MFIRCLYLYIENCFFFIWIGPCVITVSVKEKKKCISLGRSGLIISCMTLSANVTHNDKPLFSNTILHILLPDHNAL